MLQRSKNSSALAPSHVAGHVSFQLDKLLHPPTTENLVLPTQLYAIVGPTVNTWRDERLDEFDKNY
jgi:hypothetical protein